MNIKLTAQEKIQVLNGEDLFAIMQKVLLRENKIDRDKEHFWIVGLDADNRILFIELVSLGGVTSATVKPMEVFRVAVLKNAVSAILVHNHTSRDLTPSDADKDLTDRLIQVGRILNIPVFDHLIITTEDFLSFQYQGLMEELRKSLKWVPPYEIEERIRAEERRMREEAVRAAREEGEREGKGMGMREGLREGRKEGMEMGLQEGEKKGKDEGKKEKAVEIARAALAEGMEIGVVGGGGWRVGGKVSWQDNDCWFQSSAWEPQPWKLCFQSGKRSFPLPRSQAERLCKYSRNTAKHVYSCRYDIFEIFYKYCQRKLIKCRIYISSDIIIFFQIIISYSHVITSLSKNIRPPSSDGFASNCR